ncbi:hypothetical protein B0H17DRAFT_1216720 [Mycena rosella]|uniref:MYND-type domain-containing protein n=1 Tax=Mycena rosella TaxID=1033263 RepID=A0AAD7C699_MYCRO|nr:hypothetical protein B0H17DRAFT_1216720 [Mycena rosella]
MPSTSETCVCKKPATNRCSACKITAYCSTECQRGDWKAHKAHCRAANPAYTNPMAEILRVAAKHETVYDDSVALGLNPSWLFGLTGADLYSETSGSGHFWRLDAKLREDWDAKAQIHNRKAQLFWKSYLDPLTVGREWVDIVLNAVMSSRLPDNDKSWQDQANGMLLASLFPHLSKFGGAENTSLIMILMSDPWGEGTTFRLEPGTAILFTHGTPSQNLFVELIACCLESAGPAHLEKLLTYMALPLQKHWPDLAGTNIFDLAVCMVPEYRAHPRDVPGDRIIEIAGTSPAALKYLLPIVIRICREDLVSNPAAKLLGLLEAFGVGFPSTATEISRWLSTQLAGDREHTEQLQRCARLRPSESPHGIELRDFSAAEVAQLRKGAMWRLSNLPGMQL